MALQVALCAVVTAMALSLSAEIRVTDFGAKGDGVTDDTAAIQKAVSALERRRPKKRPCVQRHKRTFPDAPFEALVFPKGEYVVSWPITVNGDAMLIGEEGAKIVNKTSDKETFYFRHTYNLTVKGMTFDGGICQVRLWTNNRDCSYMHIADCKFKNCCGTSLVSVSFKEKDERPATPIETGYGEERGIPHNNSTLMVVERCQFEGNTTALQLYSDGLTIRDCRFVAPQNSNAPQLNVGNGGKMGVEMYFRDLDILYPQGAADGAAAIRYNGGRLNMENVSISASGDLIAIRSRSRFNEYHKPSCIDLKDCELSAGKAPVISFEEDKFPNRITIVGLKSSGVARQRLFAFDRVPTEESISRGAKDPGKLVHTAPEIALCFSVRDVDAEQFDITLPETLRRFEHPAYPREWKRPLVRESGATFAGDLPTQPVFSGAPIAELLEKARQAGGGVVVITSDWQEVGATLEVPDNVRITSIGRAALWMMDEDKPLFHVADGVDCVIENTMIIDGLNAVKVDGSSGRVRLLDCTLFGQKAEAIAAHDEIPAKRRIDITGGQAYTPYLYKGNAAFTVDAYWYEEGTPLDKGEYQPGFSSMVNEKGGEMYLRDFLGVPCYFQHTPMREAYVFGKNRDRRGEFRWIDNYGNYVGINVRYGGEWGGLTPIYHFGDAKTWMEGGNVEIGNVYLKPERAVVVADHDNPDVTAFNAAGGHHIEPFQVLVKRGEERYDVVESARLCGNYPFDGYSPVWPRNAKEDGEVVFETKFNWNGADDVRLDLEASSVGSVWLNGVHVGNGPRLSAQAYSRLARFKLDPRGGENELIVRLKGGEVGFVYACVMQDARMIAHTGVDGDFKCGAPLKECFKPPRSGVDDIPRVAPVDEWSAQKTEALLKKWCDALCSYQVNSPADPHTKGSFLCPACALQHGRVCDLVYPMSCLYVRTGEKRYLDCAVKAVDWSRRNLTDMNGARLRNDFQSRWWGISVFSQCAVGKTLLNFGDKLPADVKADWQDWFARQSEFVYKSLDIDGHLNVNYSSAFCEAMALAWKIMGLGKFKDKAGEWIGKIEKYFSGDGLLVGEKHPPTFVSPRGFRAVDIAYNMEESIPALYHAAEMLGDEGFLKRLDVVAKAHLEFVLPDGAIDESCGSRAEKWTYYGSRTSDGALPMFAAMAKREIPGAVRAIARHLDLLERCTSRKSGLLAGGIYYDEANEGACVHHSFAHAKAMVDLLLAGAPKSAPAHKLPREETYGTREFPVFGTTLAAVGDWRATFTVNDVHHNEKGTMAGGGSLTLLWHRRCGLLLAGTMNSYSPLERENMQVQRYEFPTLSMTPRIESGELTSSTDKHADGRAIYENGRVRYAAVGRLSGIESERSSREYKMDYTISESGVNIDVSCEGKWRYILPIVAGLEDGVIVEGKTVKIRRGAVVIAVRTDGTPCLRRTERGERAFTPIAGLMTAYLEIDPLDKSSLHVEIGVN